MNITVYELATMTAVDIVSIDLKDSNGNYRDVYVGTLKELQSMPLQDWYNCKVVELESGIGFFGRSILITGQE